MKRRSMLVGSALAGAGVALGGLPKAVDAAQVSLYVFLHSLLETRALSRLFEAALPGVAVWTLTRSRDFSAVRTRNPDAIVALAPVLLANGFTPVLQGYKGGQPSESYVLLSTRSVTASSVKSVGAIDILGRREMVKFVSSLLAGNEPQVAPVTKLADLLTLLQLGDVEAILLPARHANALVSRTRLSLTVTNLKGKGVGLPAFCPSSAAGRRMKDAFADLPSSLLQEIGVDTWR
jgi:hypothetical protein